MTDPEVQALAELLRNAWAEWTDEAQGEPEDYQAERLIAAGYGVRVAPSPTEDPYGFGPDYERHQHGDGEWCWRKVAPSPDAPDWERLYTEEAERYARLSNVHAKCAPSPDAPGPRRGWDVAEQALRRIASGIPARRAAVLAREALDALAVAGEAPSPDAPGLLAALDEFAPSLAPDYPRYARWLRAKEAIRAALAASGDAPKGSICKCGLAKSYHGPNPPILADHDYEPRYSASGDAPREGLRERAYCIHGISETQECDDCGGLSFIASESHPTKERTDG